MLRSAALASMVEARDPPRCARPSPDPPRRSAPGPSQTPPCGLHGAGARGSVTARNAGTRSRISNSRNSRSDRESEQRHSSPRCSRVDTLEVAPPGAYGSSARVAPKAPPSWPRNRAGRPPRQAVEAALDQYQLQAVVKYMTWRARHLPTSSPSSPPDDPSAVPSPSANPPSGQDTRESDHADFVQGRLRQRAAKPDLRKGASIQFSLEVQMRQASILNICQAFSDALRFRNRVRRCLSQHPALKSRTPTIPP